ncbi:MAG: peptidoglycan bridge formation glycyltransferase FemA/FemB family protein [Patescibacteria group bacterium]
MDTRKIDDAGVWDYWMKHARCSQLTQSWGWGVFQQTLGHQVTRLQIVEGDTVLAGLQLVSQPLPLGKQYLYAPRGPHMLADDESTAESIMHHCVRGISLAAKEQQAVFSRLEAHGQPWVDVSLSATANLVPTKSVQPADELHVLTTTDEDGLLAAMQEKTRYNIHLAERRGVHGRLIEDLSYAHRVFPFFVKLLQQTAKRQGIRPHDTLYYRRMIDILLPRGEVKLYVAEYDNQIIVANILGLFGDTVTYLHGASSYEHRSLMAPYLLHWEGIRHAKRSGYARYNFGGVSPEGAEAHAWANLTRFKEGFATIGKTGERVHYPQAVDLVHQRFWYRMYATSRDIRRRLRRK